MNVCMCVARMHVKEGRLPSDVIGYIWGQGGKRLGRGEVLLSVGVFVDELLGGDGGLGEGKGRGGGG